MLTFSRDVYRYRNLSQSILALSRLMIGDFDFEELQASNRLLAPILFSLFILVAYITLMNMIIAIIR